MGIWEGQHQSIMMDIAMDMLILNQIAYLQTSLQHSLRDQLCSDYISNLNFIKSLTYGISNFRRESQNKMAGIAVIVIHDIVKLQLIINHVINPY